VKRTILAFIVFVWSVYYVNAQMNQGNSFTNFHAGLIPLLQSSNASISGGGSSIETKFKVSVPPVTAEYEYAITDKITLGGFAGYYVFQHITTVKSQDYFTGETSNTEIKYKYGFIFGGAKANYYLLNISIMYMPD